MSDTVAVRRLSVREASDYLKATHGITFAPATLNKARCVGGGPVFTSFGRAILYTPIDLDAWAMSRLSGPRSSTAVLR